GPGAQAHPLSSPESAPGAANWPSLIRLQQLRHQALAAQQARLSGPVQGHSTQLNNNSARSAGSSSGGAKSKSSPLNSVANNAIETKYHNWGQADNDAKSHIIRPPHI